MISHIPEHFRNNNGDLDVARYFKVQEFKKNEREKLLSFLSLPLNLPILIVLLGLLGQKNGINIYELIETTSKQIQELWIQK